MDKVSMSYLFSFSGYQTKCVYAQPTLRRCGNVAATSLCTSQWRRRYVSNETPSDASIERHQDVSVVHLYDVLLERHNDDWNGRNNDAPPLRLHYISNNIISVVHYQGVSVVRYQDVSVVHIHDVPLARLYNVSCKSQINHPKALLWYVSTTSQSYVFATSC